MLDLGMIVIGTMIFLFIIGGLLEKKEQRKFKYMDYSNPTKFVSFKID